MKGKRAQFLRTLAEMEAAAADDPRPVSGNVGQNCLGFLTLPSGKVVRIVRNTESGDQLGPGSYSPNKPDTFTKSVKISPNSKRFDWDKPQYQVGPADHYQRQSSSRIPRSIGLKQPSPPPVPWKSFNMGHPDWSPTAKSKDLPKRRFPMFKFEKAKANNSRPFASTKERNLFNIGDVNDLMYDTFPRPVQPNYDITKQSPVFKSDIPRYSDPINPTPAPCTYYLPDTFGSGRKTGLEDLWLEHDADPPFSTPGPGAYDPVVRKRVVDVTIGKRIGVHNKDNFPGPGAYDVEVAADTRIPVTFKAKDRRKSQEWCTTPSMMSDSPGAGAYDVERKWEPKGGLISGGKRMYLIDEREARRNDHKLAFSTTHSGMLMPTSNSKYQRSIARSSLA